jgi:hypothetical protein
MQEMNVRKVSARGSLMTLLFILVLALDIGGAGSILAIGAAKAHGDPVGILTGP